MDPFTAALIVSAIVSTGYSIYAANKANNQAIDEQNRLQAQQESARIANVNQQAGIAAQRTNAALTQASTRNKNVTSPSFAAQSMLGQLPSVALTKGTETGANPQNKVPTGASGTF